MKKLLAITALGVLSLTSCRKDYTCSCTATDSFYNTDLEYKNVKKKDAQADCDTKNTSYPTIAGWKCELK